MINATDLEPTLIQIPIHGMVAGPGNGNASDMSDEMTAQVNGATTSFDRYGTKSSQTHLMVLMTTLWIDQ